MSCPFCLDPEHGSVKSCPLASTVRSILMWMHGDGEPPCGALEAEARKGVDQRMVQLRVKKAARPTKVPAVEAWVEA